MFRMNARRTARGMAVGALILSLTAFGGSASAAPSTEEGHDCSTLAHERNEAVHMLHDAWKAFRSDLQDLAREARKLQKEAHKSGIAMTSDARQELANAKEELAGIWTGAHEEIRGLVELGQACKDVAEEVTTTDTTSTEEDEPRFDTSELAEKYRDTVDQAIEEMQKLVDDMTAAVAEMTAAAETASTADDAKVKESRGKAKDERGKSKENRGKGKGRG